MENNLDLNIDDSSVDIPDDQESDNVEASNDSPVDVQEGIPEDLPADLLECLPEDIPEDPPEDIPEDLPEDIPEDLPEDLPEDIPEDIPEDLSEDIPEDLPEDIPEDLPEDIPKDLPEGIPEDIPEDIPENIPEDVPNNLPQDILTTTECQRADISEQIEQGNEVFGSDASALVETDTPNYPLSNSESVTVQFEKNLDDLMALNLSGEEKKAILGNLKNSLQRQQVSSGADDTVSDQGHGNPVRVLKRSSSCTSAAHHDYPAALAEIDMGIQNAQELYKCSANIIMENVESITKDSSLSYKGKQEQMACCIGQLQNLERQWRQESAPWYAEKERLHQLIADNMQGYRSGTNQNLENDMASFIPDITKNTNNSTEAISRANKEFSDAPQNVSELIRDVLDQNVTAQKLPSKKRFTWDDDARPGNSACSIRDDAKVVLHNKSTGKNAVFTGAEFKTHMRDVYGKDSVDYHHREPDFTPFEQSFRKEDIEQFIKEKYSDRSGISVLSDHPGHVDIDKMGINRNDTYGQATAMVADRLGIDKKIVADYMSEKNLTWHECGDRKTIRAIPTEINSVFGHTGGIGIEQDFEALQAHINQALSGGTLSLQRECPQGYVDATEFDRAVQSNRALLKEQKKSLRKE